MNAHAVFRLQDDNDRIYRKELLDAAAIASNVTGITMRPKTDNIEAAAAANEDLQEEAARAIQNLWKFCRKRFSAGKSVEIRPGRNCAATEVSVSDWWGLKEWTARYRQGAAGNYLLESLHDYCRHHGIDLPRVGITFGSTPEEIYNTTVFFRNQFDPAWMRDELNQRMIRDVDRSTVQGEYSIISPVLGNISPFMLSGGVKTLILIHEMPDRIFNASNCGDNCAKWILKIGRATDFDITLHHIMDFGGRRFHFYITNDKNTVSTMGEYIDSAARNLH